LKVFSTAEYAEYAEAGLQKLAKDTEVDGEAASSDQPDISNGTGSVQVSPDHLSSPKAHLWLSCSALMLKVRLTWLTKIGIFYLGEPGANHPDPDPDPDRLKAELHT
jgi:hypothetical protein